MAFVAVCATQRGGKLYFIGALRVFNIDGQNIAEDFSAFSTSIKCQGTTGKCSVSSDFFLVQQGTGKVVETKGVASLSFTGDRFTATNVTGTEYPTPRGFFGLQSGHGVTSAGLPYEYTTEQLFSPESVRISSTIIVNGKPVAFVIEDFKGTDEGLFNSVISALKNKKTTLKHGVISALKTPLIQTYRNSK